MKERELIDTISALIDVHPADLLQGIGDDCAVVQKNAQRVWLLTMDTLLESVHFDLSFHPPEMLGHKCIAVNVSDIAAMGGEPLFVLLSLGLPAGFSPAFVERFSAGLVAACRHYGCVLIGGDTVRSPGGVNITVTVIGEAATSEVIYRRGARVGDTIWVSGPLGSAAAGLELCRAGHHHRPEPRFRPLLEAHLAPRARVTLGRALARSGLVSAMLDLSDGLATDLAHLCKQSGVGALVEAQKLPAHEALAPAAQLLGCESLSLMLSGGEDYELLFTAPPASTASLLQLAAGLETRLYPVGVIEAGAGVQLLTGDALGSSAIKTDISYQGYDHFRGAA